MSLQIIQGVVCLTVVGASSCVVQIKPQDKIENVDQWIGLYCKSTSSMHGVTETSMHAQSVDYPGFVLRD